MHRNLLAATAALTLSLLASCAVAQEGSIEKKDAWARATPGGAQTAAAYVTVASATGDKLTGASSPVAKEAQLHSMNMENGVMKMRQVDGIDLPAGKTVTLQPGGYHIMLTGLTQPLTEGQMFPLTLTFAKAGPHEVKVMVQKIGAMGPGKPSNMPGMDMPMHH